MSASPFPLQNVLEYRRQLRDQFQRETQEAADALAYVEEQIRELNRRRAQATQLLVGGGRGEKRERRLRELVSDLWLQMLSLQPLARKHRNQLSSIEGRSYRADRDVDALERVREHSARRKRLARKDRGIAGRIGHAPKKRAAHVE